MDILPRGLPLNADELLIFSLFLAQQRRLNIQMDSGQPDNSLWATVRKGLPLPERQPDFEEIRGVHRIVTTRLDSDIDRASTFFCTDHRVPSDSEPAIDWRVALRFMAQSVYSRVSAIEPKKMLNHPRRFELALVARDLAAEVADRRHKMFGAFAGTYSPPPAA